MPELPEVEVIKISLNKKIKDKKVKKVIVRNRNLRFKIKSNFEKFIKNTKILKVQRFSKYLIFYLSEKKFLLIHLGMSGTLHILHKKKINYITNTSFYNNPTLPKKHNHVEIFFENFKVIYNDPRRFGFIEIFDDFKKLKKKFSFYGPEPFDKKFDEKYVHNFLKKKEKNIKNFLLDQFFVSGIGNIYANEILFFCKLSPFKLAKNLNKLECKKLVKFSKHVLHNAIKQGGSSIRDFKNLKGQTGSFQKNFKVYAREGQVCKNYKCNKIIIKKFISNRSTFFCDYCQK